MQLATEKVKPLLRGHLHQAGFFVAMGACLMLLEKAWGKNSFGPAVVYSLSLVTLLGISALYHRPMWNPRARARMRRLDHTAIFALIAGTAVPVSLLGVRGPHGKELLGAFVVGAGFGSLRSLFWTTAPKWISTLVYVAVGALAFPFLRYLKSGLSPVDFYLLLGGGVVYAIGAVIYALKKPNPWPRHFGYHEVFHTFVNVAAAMHFIVVDRLL